MPRKIFLPRPGGGVHLHPMQPLATPMPTGIIVLLAFSGLGWWSIAAGRSR